MEHHKQVQPFLQALLQGIGAGNDRSGELSTAEGIALIGSIKGRGSAS